MSHKCPARVSHESVLQECQSVLQECSARVSHKNVQQECPTRVPRKSVLQECPARVSYKGVPEECPTRVFRNESVPQRFPKRSVLSVPQKWHKSVKNCCVFVFEHVFAFGFVGSILFLAHVRLQRTMGSDGE